MNQNDPPKIVLGVAAHADDLDFGCAASLAKWAQDGADVHLLIVTNGDKGSADANMTSEELAKVRRLEQENAGKIIGAKSISYLNYEDGELELTLPLKKDIVRHIRKIKPDTVVTSDPTFIYSVEQGFLNHPDHRAAAQATLDAIYPLARDRLSFPELLEEGYEPHKVKSILLTSFTDGNYFVDVTKTIELKKEALRSHFSQTPEFESIWDRIKKYAEKSGAKRGVQYAESFIRIDMFL